MKILTVVFFAAAITLLASCGGGSGSGSGGGGSGSGSGSGGGGGITGNVIDSPVKGLVYTAIPSNRSGITGPTGNYSAQTGDTVHFCLPTSANQTTCSTASEIFSYTPTTPNSQVVVTELLGGVQVAQLLQSVGQSSGSGANSLLDISSFASSSANTPQIISEVQEWIKSGGTVPQPSIIKVTASDALTNVATYLTGVSPLPIPAGYFNNSTFIVSSPCKNQSGPSGYYRLIFGSTDANGIFSNFNDRVSGSQNYTSSTSVSGSNLTMNLSVGGVSYTDVSTFNMIGIGGGTYSNVHTETPPSNPPRSCLTNGIFTKIDSSANGLTLASLANKKLIVNLGGDGNPTYNQFCDDNKIVYSMGALQNNSISYIRSCNVTATKKYNFDTAGSITESFGGITAPKGLLVFNETRSTYVMGLVNGGTLSSGSLAMSFNNGMYAFNGINGQRPYAVVTGFSLN